MNTFDREHLRNIRAIFVEKTGAAPPRPARRPVRAALILAAALICCLGLTAFAAVRFSSLSGDDLGLEAHYQGDGIVSIQVENRSDRPLTFQPQLKLMRWSTGQEVSTLGGEVSFQDTSFPAHTTGTMTVDLSAAYDLEVLEAPLTDDHYYLVLTNNDFAFGQDWMCTVSFAPTVQAETEVPQPLAPAESDQALVQQVQARLQPYFDDLPTEADLRRAKIHAYFADCQALFQELDVTPVAPADLPLGLDQADPQVIFDPAVPADQQDQLVAVHLHTADGYGLPIGADEHESALVVSAAVPQYQGDTIGGALVPLVYLAAYETASIQSPQDWAFLHGQLLTFAQLEPYKVYDDGRYVCYDVTDLFYTDLEDHVEGILSQRTDHWLDEGIWARIRSIHDYYRDPQVLQDRLYQIDKDS